MLSVRSDENLTVSSVNLLVDPWLSVTTPTGETECLSLPELFSAMEKNTVAGFPAARAHQADPWHAFLVHLGVHCLEQERQSLPAPCPAQPWTLVGQHSPAQWLDMLRGLTPNFEDDEPWQLAVDDVSKPAFLQPPVPEKKLDGFKRVENTPDELDILVSSKNFDIKSGTMKQISAEDWVFALVSLQTNGSYMGRGNFGISRANGGFGTRCFVSLRTSSLPGGAWARDCRVILENADPDNDKSVYGQIYEVDGKRLLWLEPWDGSSSLRLEQLHPMYVEVCRRVRLRETPSGIEALLAPSKCARIDAKDKCGDVGDPWIPTESDGKKRKAFGSKFSYKNVSKILCGCDDSKQFKRSLLLDFCVKTDCAENLKIRCAALMKGQGKTEGYVERVIPVRVRDRCRCGEESLRQAARCMIESAETAERKVLKIALAVFLSARRSSDAGTIDWGAADVKNWTQLIVDRMDSKVNDIFFEKLWDVGYQIECGASLEMALCEWNETLIALVREHFAAAVEALPCGAACSLRSKALAELKLEALIKSAFGSFAERQAALKGESSDEQ